MTTLKEQITDALKTAMRAKAMATVTVFSWSAGSHQANRN